MMMMMMMMMMMILTQIIIFYLYLHIISSSWVETIIMFQLLNFHICCYLFFSDIIINELVLGRRLFENGQSYLRIGPQLTLKISGGI